MAIEIRSAIDFYQRHPISAQGILAKLRAARGSLHGLRPEDLFPLDQDHYGGLAANDALAERAGIGRGTRVADFCAGLGGPARYLAHRYGADVTGIELTPARVAGARHLTTLVGLESKVRVLEGNVLEAPLADGSMDVVVSQEALLHVPDLGGALAEAWRVLRPGGRIALTNTVAHAPLAEADARLMWDGMAIGPLHGIAAHADLLKRAGFEVQRVEDLTAEWASILVERLAMYRRLRVETEQSGAPAGHDAFYESYVRYVDLMGAGVLGGVRLTARRG